MIDKCPESLVRKYEGLALESPMVSIPAKKLLALIKRIRVAEEVCVEAEIVKFTSQNNFDSSCSCVFCAVLKQRIKAWRKFLEEK